MMPEQVRGDRNEGYRFKGGDEPFLSDDRARHGCDFSSSQMVRLRLFSRMHKLTSSRCKSRIESGQSSRYVNAV
jgi:hypothetical protein